MLTSVLLLSPRECDCRASTYYVRSRANTGGRRGSTWARTCRTSDSHPSFPQGTSIHQPRQSFAKHILEWHQTKTTTKHNQTFFYLDTVKCRLEINYCLGWWHDCKIVSLIVLQTLQENDQHIDNTSSCRYIQYTVKGFELLCCTFFVINSSHPLCVSV